MLAGDPALALDEIQGDVLVGLQKNAELFLFFRVADLPAFKRRLRQEIVGRLTSTWRAQQRDRTVKPWASRAAAQDRLGRHQSRLYPPRPDAAARHRPRPARSRLRARCRRHPDDCLAQRPAGIALAAAIPGRPGRRGVPGHRPGCRFRPPARRSPACDARLQHRGRLFRNRRCPRRPRSAAMSISASSMAFRSRASAASTLALVPAARPMRVAGPGPGLAGRVRVRLSGAAPDDPTVKQGRPAGDGGAVDAQRLATWCSAGWSRGAGISPLHPASAGAAGMLRSCWPSRMVGRWKSGAPLEPAPLRDDLALGPRRKAEQ